MQIQELINSREIIEPETYRLLLPTLTENELEQVQVLNLMKNTEYFWKDMGVFEKAVLVLNGIKPEVGFRQGLTPEQIWYGVHIAKQLRDFPYSYEVQQYIRWISNKNGVYIYPPEVGLENPSFTLAKHRAENGPFPIRDDTSIEIQAGKYLAIKMYMDQKEAEEVVKSNLEKTSEASLSVNRAPTSYSPELSDGGSSSMGEKQAALMTWIFKAFNCTLGEYFDDGFKLNIDDPITVPISGNINYTVGQVDPIGTIVYKLYNTPTTFTPIVYTYSAVTAPPVFTGYSEHTFIFSGANFGGGGQEHLNCVLSVEANTRYETTKLLYFRGRVNTA